MNTITETPFFRFDSSNERKSEEKKSTQISYNYHIKYKEKIKQGLYLKEHTADEQK